MKQFFTNLFKKKPNKKYLSEDGCPVKCHICGSKGITMTRTLNAERIPVKKYVSCVECKKQLARWDNDKWYY
jgi:hypothetical protein